MRTDFKIGDIVKINESKETKKYNIDHERLFRVISIEEDEFPGDLELAYLEGESLNLPDRCAKHFFDPSLWYIDLATPVEIAQYRIDRRNSYGPPRKKL